MTADLRQRILDLAEGFVQQELGGDATGHDWWHACRVAEMARRIAAKEGADAFVCQLAAWLHDIADDKLTDEEAGLEKLNGWMHLQGVGQEVIDHVLLIIQTMSFKGGNRAPMATLEGRVVQDADRLDALGAVGIARTFAYSGAKGQLIHHPGVAPRTVMTPKEYRLGRSTAINHFYEKLLSLKDLMNTDYARRMAEERHRFMETYLEEFLAEWNGAR